MSAKPSWRCAWCWSVNKITFPCCPGCGGKWEECLDPSYVSSGSGSAGSKGSTYSPNQWQDPPWPGQDHRQEFQGRQKSPRARRPKSPRNSNQDKQGKHGGGKGKHKQQQQQQANDSKGKKGTGKDWNQNQSGKGQSGKGPSGKAPTPAWNRPSEPQRAPPPPPPTTPTAAELKLQELTEALQSEEITLTPKIHGIIAETRTDNVKARAQDELQQMQNSAARLYQAKKQLAIAEQARYNMHVTWQKHLVDSVAQWQTWTKEFEEQEATMKEQVETARNLVHESRKAWEETKDAEAMEISDTEETSTEKTDTGEAIKEGMSELLKNLEAVKNKADSSLPEPPLKKSRGEGDAPGRLGVRALEPFGGAVR